MIKHNPMSTAALLIGLFMAASAIADSGSTLLRCDPAARCSKKQLQGATQCKTPGGKDSDIIGYCCPSGQDIVGGKCMLRCAPTTKWSKTPIQGGTQCVVDSVRELFAYSCPEGQEIQEGKCVIPLALCDRSARCSKTQVEGATQCKSVGGKDSNVISYCCPSGQDLVGGKCVARSKQSR
jgi:hypothetical protein